MALMNIGRLTVRKQSGIRTIIGNLSMRFSIPNSKSYYIGRISTGLEYDPAE